MLSQMHGHGYAFSVCVGDSLEFDAVLVTAWSVNYLASSNLLQARELMLCRSHACSLKL